MKRGIKIKYYWDYFRQTPNGIFMGHLYHNTKDNKPKFLKGYACAYKEDKISVTIAVPAYEEEYYN